MRYRIPGETKQTYRIFGPFTVGQFLCLAAGGLAAWGLLRLPLPAILRFLGGGVALGVGMALGFLEPEGEKAPLWLWRICRYWRRQRTVRYGFGKDGGGSTQEIVALGGIGGGVLRTGDRQARVFQVGAVNFDLKSDAEKETCLVAYREFLNSLSFPVQMLAFTKVKRLDSYLEFLRVAAGREDIPSLGWHAAAQLRFVQGLLATRRILTHQHFLVVWEENQEEAGGRLAERKLAVEKGLVRLGLSPRLLGEGELTEMLATVWSGTAGTGEDFTGYLTPGCARSSGGTVELARGVPALADLLAPDSLEVKPDHLRVGERFARTLAVIGYPREVSGGWLDGLYAFPADLRISAVVEPLDSRTAVRQLTEQLKYHQGAILADQRQGRVPDPYLQAAFEDARDLRDRLARSQVRIFQYHLEVTIWADSLEELDRRTKELESEMGGKLLIWRRCRLQQLEAFRTTLPAGEETVARRRNLDSFSLSTTFPFVSGELAQSGGDIWGLNQSNNSLVLLDRFSFMSPHTVTVAASGAGKSYWLKYLLTQSRFRREGGIVLDASDREYQGWCEALGGQYVRLGVGSPDHVNPLEISPPAARRRSKQDGKPLSRKAVYLRGLLQLLVPDLTPAELAFLDGVLFRLYRRYGYEDTWDSFFQEPNLTSVGKGGMQFYLQPRAKPMPTLGDLVEVLRGSADGRRMATLLDPFVAGSLALFNGETSVDLGAEVVVFDVHEVVTGHPDLAAPSYFILTEFVWQRLRAGKRRRVVAIDEAHYLLGHAPTAAFVEGLFRASRKLGAGISLITQSIHDFLGREDNGGKAARACLANAPLVLLMKANNQEEVETMGDFFSLSQREKEFLAAARRGEGLLLAGSRRVALKVEVPPELHRLITTDPGEVAKLEEEMEDIERGEPA